MGLRGQGKVLFWKARILTTPHGKMAMDSKKQFSNINDVCVGLFTFIVILIVGYFLTDYVRDKAVLGLPRAEVYEALHRDGLSLQYTLIGWLLTLVTAILGTFVVVWYFVRNKKL